MAVQKGREAFKNLRFNNNYNDDSNRNISAFHRSEQGLGPEKGGKQRSYADPSVKEDPKVRIKKNLSNKSPKNIDAVKSGIKNAAARRLKNK